MFQTTNRDKNMKVSWDYSSQLNGKIKFMFQTTSQDILWNFRQI